MPVKVAGARLFATAGNWEIKLSLLPLLVGSEMTAVT